MERGNRRIVTLGWCPACHVQKASAEHSGQNRKVREPNFFGTKNNTAKTSQYGRVCTLSSTTHTESTAIFSVQSLNGKKITINTPDKALKVALERLGSTIVDTLHADVDLLVVDPQDNFQQQWRATAMSIPVMTKSYLSAQLDENCLKQRSNKRSLSSALCTYFHSWKVVLRHVCKPCTSLPSLESLVVVFTVITVPC